MSDFRGIREKYNDISIVGSRSAGLMTEFKTEAGKPIYISETGEIVSEKSRTLRFNGKWVNVPSIHDGIEYSEDQLLEMLEDNKIKPTSTHKSLGLAEKAAQKRSPSLMSEETIRNIEKKYSSEMTKRKATASELTEEPTALKTPDAKAEEQMDNLMKIQDDPYLLVEDDKEQKIEKYMSTLSEQDKEGIKNYLEKPTAKINSVEDEGQMSNFPKESGIEVDDQTITAFSEGGLKDEGGTIDPVSGNDVPAGSTQKEVRDDIPAQLSEGEFVLPADVVRYIGLENLMELRNKAKQGLAQMEAMGQMGNSEEATMDDTADMDVDIDAMIDEFDPNDPSTMEFNVGGAVLPNYLGTTPPQQQFSYGFMPPAQQGFQAPGYSPMPQQSQFITSPARTVVGQPPVAPELRRYVGPNGEILMIPFYDGKPMKGYTIPAGYKFKAEEEAVAEAPEVAQPVVSQPDGGGDGPSREEQEAEADRLAFDAYETRAMVELEKSLGLGTKVADAWAMDPRSQLGPNATLMDHVKALAKVGGPIGAVATGINTTITKSDFYDTLSKDLDITRDEAKELIKLEAIPQYVEKVTTGERDSVDVNIGGNTYGVTKGGGVVGGRTTLTPSEAARRAATAATQITVSQDKTPGQAQQESFDRASDLADSLGFEDRSSENQDYGGGSGDATQSDSASFGGDEGWD